MGQRSQIYVAVKGKEEDMFIANYYNWNYGERMISRARYGIERLKEDVDQNYGDWFWKDHKEKISRIFDTNFDMKDVAISSNIIKEYEEYDDDAPMNDFIFNEDNNDGKLLVLVNASDQTIKYAFLDYDNNLDKIMDAKQYMDWNEGKKWKTPTEHLNADDIATCKENIAAISECATLMTKEEVEQFLTADYSFALSPEYLAKQKEKLNPSCEKTKQMKAVNIEWDTDGDTNVNLPSEIEIPLGMTGEDEISDFLSDSTGYCHKGFTLEEKKPSVEIDVKKPQKDDVER